MMGNWKNIIKRYDSKYSYRVIIKWLWKAWKGNRLQASLNALIGLLGVALSLTQVWAVKHAVDVASRTIEGSVYWSVALMGVLVLCNFALGVASVWVKNILGIKAQNRMQQRMLDRILRSEWHGRETHHSGDVINRLEGDVSHIVTFLTETIPNTLATLALFIGAFVYLFSMDKMLALVIVGMLPVFAVFSKVYMRQMRRLTRKVRDSGSKVQSILQETVQNRMLIKTLESDDLMIGRLEGSQSELRHNVVRRTFFSVFSHIMLSFGFALGYLIAFLWSALRMYEGTLSFGGMTAFLQLVNKIQGPARSLTKLVPSFVAVCTAAERLLELEEEPEEEQGEPVELDAPCGVRFNHVSYAYTPEDGEVISDLSFDFYPGSCTAVIGETGAGKTTLVRMVLALLHPQKGSIEMYNKQESHELSPRMRCNLVYVPQGNTLMSGTIRENLLLGKPTATEEEIHDALMKSCADFVFDLPEGIDTVCDESGGGLSEGQAQRISIARALLRNRSIMIFDEATSALDPETERQLLNNILASSDKTIIFITHRPAVIEYCHQSLEIHR